jgi:hypothetical protein
VEQAARKEELVTSHDFIERLKQTPLARKLIADDEQELDAQRAAALASIKDARARSQREIPPLRARVAKCLDTMRVAEKALTSAQHEYAGASRAVTLASDDETSAVTKAEAILLDTAPDAVKKFQRWLWDEFDRLRHTVETYPAGSSGHPALGGRKRTFIHTNSRSVKRYLDAIQAARQEVHRLVLTEPSRAVIEAGLNELHRGLPNSIHMEVVEGQH